MTGDTGEVFRTTGRESQVYTRRPDQGWRLVHVSVRVAVRIIEIERANSPGEWFDLTTGMEDGKRLGSNCLNIDQRVHVVGY